MTFFVEESDHRSARERLQHQKSCWRVAYLLKEDDVEMDKRKGEEGVDGGFITSVMWFSEPYEIEANFNTYCHRKEE